MHRSTSLLLALAVVPAVVGSPTPAAAAEQAPATYTKKAVAVYAVNGEPHGHALRDGLSGLGRFHVLSVPASSGEAVPAYLAKVKSASQAAGLGATPAYVFVPRYALGRVGMDKLETNRQLDKSTGKLNTTVSSAITCQMRANVDVYEVATGRLIKQFVFTPTLRQAYEYHYSNQTSDEAIRLKSIEFTERMAHDIRMPVEDLFGRRAVDEMSGLMRGSVVSGVRAMDEFKLVVGVTGWDAKADRIFFGLGRDLKVRVDDGFKIFQNGREIGFVKVRRVDANSSQAQPIFIQDGLRIGDTITEYPKANWWNSLKGGMVWMGGPAFIASYDGDIDIGTNWNWDEFFLSYRLGGLTNGKAGGSIAELGLARKFFWRRWGLSVGPRVGVVGLTGSTNNAVAPGLTLASSVNCYLTPDLVWTTSADFQAYTPIDPTRMGFAAGLMPKAINPFGPSVQTGLTFVF